MTIDAAPLTNWAGRSVESLRTEWQLPALFAYARVGSTNDVARTLAENGAPPLTVVVADEQSAGRGRFGRTWTAPARSSLLLSIILRPQGGPAAAPSVVPLRLGIATADAISTESGVPARVKWPNDVLAPDDRKLAGILCEAATSASGGFVIAGVGINANQSALDWPADLRATATSLREITGHEVDRTALAGALLSAVARNLARIDRTLDVNERAEWRARDALYGRAVHLDGEAAGTADGVTPHGALRIRTSRGTRILWSGTVRPSPSLHGHAEEMIP